jgi:hypothetical protein
MNYEDLAPTKLLAGMILTKYDELAGRLRRLAAERNQEQEEASEKPHSHGS